METLLLLSFLGWSITNVLVNGSILDPVRVYLQIMHPSLAKLLTCMQCSGFWVGVLVGFLITADQLINPLSGLVIGNSIISDTVLVTLMGFLVSGTSVVVNSLLIYLINSSAGKINRDGEI
jgi:hypothetical protein